MVKLKLPDELFAVIQEKDISLQGYDFKPPGHVYCFWPTLETAEAWKEGMVFGGGMKVIHVRMTTVRKLRCDEHPRYKASMPPRGDCHECWGIWRAIGNPPPP